MSNDMVPSIQGSRCQMVPNKEKELIQKEYDDLFFIVAGDQQLQLLFGEDLENLRRQYERA